MIAGNLMTNVSSYFTYTDRDQYQKGLLERTKESDIPLSNILKFNKFDETESICNAPKSDQPDTINYPIKLNANDSWI